MFFYKVFIRFFFLKNNVSRKDTEKYTIQYHKNVSFAQFYHGIYTGLVTEFTWFSHKIYNVVNFTIKYFSLIIY
jgi:hypothetical protein